MHHIKMKVINDVIKYYIFWILKCVIPYTELTVKKLGITLYEP